MDGVVMNLDDQLILAKAAGYEDAVIFKTWVSVPVQYEDEDGQYNTYPVFKPLAPEVTLRLMEWMKQEGYGSRLIEFFYNTETIPEAVAQCVLKIKQEANDE
jgi:hypothetical protein